MMVAPNRSVELIDRRSVGLAVYDDPLFELHIRRFVAADEVNRFLAVDAQRVQRQCVKPGAAFVVALRQRAGGRKRDFEPETRQMQGAERTCGAGAYQRYYLFFRFRCHVVTSYSLAEKWRTPKHLHRRRRLTVTRL